MGKQASLFTAATLLGCAIFSFAGSPAAKFRVAHEFSVAGDDKWDLLAVDEASGRLFVSHGTQVQAVDEKSGKVLGAVTGIKGAHGIALAPEANKGYVSDGKDTSVIVFDMKTLATLGKVKTTGANPDAMLYDPFSRLVFCFNGKGGNATVIDPKTDKVAATVPLDGKPELAVSDGKGNIYVNIEDKSMVAVIDAKALKAVKSWPLAPGESPSGLALDRETGRLFAVCENKLMVVLDAASGKVTATLPIGQGVDGAAFDPALKLAYSSNGEGTLTVVKEEDKDHFKVLENVPTRKGARTLAVDAVTHRVFLPTAEFGPAPAPTPENPKGRPPVKPGSFVILDVEPSI